MPGNGVGDAKIRHSFRGAGKMRQERNRWIPIVCVAAFAMLLWVTTSRADDGGLNAQQLAACTASGGVSSDPNLPVDSAGVACFAACKKDGKLPFCIAFQTANEGVLETVAALQSECAKNPPTKTCQLACQQPQYANLAACELQSGLNPQALAACTASNGASSDPTLSAEWAAHACFDACKRDGKLPFCIVLKTGNEGVIDTVANLQTECAANPPSKTCQLICKQPQYANLAACELQSGLSPQALAACTASNGVSSDPSLPVDSAGVTCFAACKKDGKLPFCIAFQTANEGVLETVAALQSECAKNPPTKTCQLACQQPQYANLAECELQSGLSPQALAACTTSNGASSDPTLSAEWAAHACFDACKKDGKLPFCIVFKTGNQGVTDTVADLQSECAANPPSQVCLLTCQQPQFAGLAACSELHGAKAVTPIPVTKAIEMLPETGHGAKTTDGEEIPARRGGQKAQEMLGKQSTSKVQEMLVKQSAPKAQEMLVKQGSPKTQEMMVKQAGPKSQVMQIKPASPKPLVLQQQPMVLPPPSAPHVNGKP